MIARLEELRVERESRRRANADRSSQAVRSAYRFLAKAIFGDLIPTVPVSPEAARAAYDQRRLRMHDQVAEGAMIVA
jgi:hypothetical protein